MNRPVYDLDALRRGRIVVAGNIEAFEAALLKEREKLSEYDKQIAVAETILQAHGICTAGPDHDWEILDIFPLSGSWKRRRCRCCKTEQRLGQEG